MVKSMISISFAVLLLWIQLMISGHTKDLPTKTAKTMHPSPAASNHPNVYDTTQITQISGSEFGTRLVATSKYEPQYTKSLEGQCQSVVLSTIKRFHTNNTISNWLCAQGRLCQFSPFLQAYTLKEDYALYDLYMKGLPDPCQADGSPCRAGNSNFTMGGHEKAIFACDCQQVLFLPRFYKDQVVDDKGNVYKCDIDSISKRMVAKGLPPARVHHDNVACTTSKDPKVCVCDIRNGEPSNYKNETCSNMWAIADGPGSPV